MILLIRNCVYCLVIIISFFSVVSLKYSSNNNKFICEKINIINKFYIYFLICNLIILNVLYIPTGLEMIYIYPVVFVAIILYLLSNSLNFKKYEKLQLNEKNKKITFLTIGLILLPVLSLSLTVFINFYLVNNSELIVVYESDGNGGFGSGDTFAYAISKNFCSQFDLGIDFKGYDLKKFLPKNAIEIHELDDVVALTNYKIIFNEDDNVFVYKDNKQICKINNKSRYFNIDFETGFYLNN